MKCFVHSENDAVGVCNHCAKSICAECSVELKGERYCKECVAAKAGQPQKKEHSPSLAAFLSVIISGLGQIYNGQPLKGIGFFLNPLIVLGAAGIAAFLMRGLGYPSILVIVACALAETLIVYIYGIRDAYCVAGKIKTGQIELKQKMGCIIGFIIGIVALVMAVFVIAMVAAIAIPNLLKARIQANEQSAQAIEKRISAGIKLYRLANNGRYPESESALLTANPPCLDQSYSYSSINGYSIQEQFNLDGYKIIAFPLRCNMTGTKIFTATTGGKISFTPCSEEETTKE
jgi:type II secretory pathway pseudopilin PulG/TM2 domain-containing membrane protein YozV